MRLGLSTLGLVGKSYASIDTDAAAWAAAVTTNGGTYSASTLAAVSTFCKAAKASGYWSKLNRINLFCGDQLAACLVPLKVGGGSATETNVNFVAGDYSEATGLTGNGSTKCLRTGLVPSASLTLNDTHLAVYNRSSGTAGFSIGALDSTSQTTVLYAPFEGGTTGLSDQYNQTVGAGRVASTLTAPFGFVVGSRTAAAAHAIYRNGSLLNSNTGSGGSLSTFEIYVGATNQAGTATTLSTGAMAGYSIGSGLTSTDVSNYNTDMQSFQQALGRNV